MTQAIRGSRFLPLNTLDAVALVTSLPNAFAFAGSGGQDVGVSFWGCALTRRPEQGPAGAGQAFHTDLPSDVRQESSFSVFSL